MRGAKASRMLPHPWRHSTEADDRGKGEEPSPIGTDWNKVGPVCFPASSDHRLAARKQTARSDTKISNSPSPPLTSPLLSFVFSTSTKRPRGSRARRFLVAPFSLFGNPLTKKEKRLETRSMNVCVFVLPFFLLF